MARTCSDCGVRDRALCSSLNNDELEQLGRLGMQRRLLRGETLLRAGDPPLVCANLQSGAMKITHLGANGSEAIVGLVYPGDFIGWPYAGANDHDVVALTDVELCVFPRAGFERALGDHRRMEQQLLRRTHEELTRARDWLSRLARASAGARVAAFLADTARRLGPSDCRRVAGSEAPEPGTTFDLPLSRGEIADVLGLTIETVSRQMTRLRAAGTIALPGGRAIVITDPAALASAAAAGD